MIDENYLDGSENRRIRGFRIKGHSDYGEAGSDVVCAAVSATTIMAEATINDVLFANATVKERNDSITLTLPASCEDEEAIQAVLNGMLMTLMYLREEYPDFIEVSEV